MVTQCVVIVTGMRDWPDRPTIYRVLDEELQTWLTRPGVDVLAHPGATSFVLRHGVSGNADFAANAWGLERGVTIERFHAKWHEPSGFNPSAGPVRNKQMAQAIPRADKGIAFWDGTMRKRGPSSREFSGTLDCIRAILAQGIPLRIEPPSATVG